MYAHTCIHASHTPHTCTQACIHTHNAPTHTYTQMHTHAHTPHSHTPHTCTHRHTCTHIHTTQYTHMYTMHTHIVYIHNTDMHAHIHTLHTDTRKPLTHTCTHSRAGANPAVHRQDLLSVRKTSVLCARPLGGSRRPSPSKVISSRGEMATRHQVLQPRLGQRRPPDAAAQPRV